MEKYKNACPEPTLPDKIIINDMEKDDKKFSYDFNESINTIKLIWNENLENINCLFFLCSNITKVDFTHFDSSSVESMGAMFRDCISLTEVDFTNFNPSNLKGIHYMFYNCTSLKSIDLSNFDTSKITSMMYMFYNCISL